MRKRNYSNEEQRDLVFSIFEKCGISPLKTKNFSFENLKTDIDVLGVYKNLIIIVECVGSSQSLGQKIRKFKTDSDLIVENYDRLKDILEKEYNAYFEKNKDSFLMNKTEIKFRKLIVDLNKESRKKIRENPESSFIINLCERNNIFLWTFEEYFYFDKISKTEFKYGKYRIFEFLKVNPGELKEDFGGPLIYLAVGNKTSSDMYILNMVIPVEILLKKSSIKRLHSWDQEGFQRLIEEKKIEAMREYLIKEMQLYPNNIIVLLRDNTNVIEINNGNEISFNVPEKLEYLIHDLKRNMLGKLFIIQIPNTYDAFQIIDGQHRLFSFAQTEYSKYKLEEKTRNLRDEERINEISKELERYDRKLEELVLRSSLLVTGILNTNIKEEKLFLDINKKQTYIKAEDFIDLTEKLYPDDPITKVNKLLRMLNEKGVLGDKIKFKPWQEERIKRTSLINYSGLKNIFDSNKKSYKIFTKAHEKIDGIISDYINFCFILINNYLWCLVEQVREKYGREINEMCNDLSLKKYYLFYAVFIGALIRLLRHFISERDNEFKILDKLKSSILKGNNEEDTLKKNIKNAKLQNLFSDGLKIIVDNLTFTKNEFEQKEGWGSNKWARIEADLFYLIKNHYSKFGDEMLISSKYRHS